MYRKKVTIVGLGLISLSTLCYSSELLEELLTLLPAEKESSHLETIHPDLVGKNETFKEQDLNYTLNAEEVEESFTVSDEELILLNDYSKRKLKRKPPSSQLVDGLASPLIEKSVEEKHFDEKKPAASHEGSRKEELKKLRLNPELDGEKSNCTLECEKEQLSLISQLKARARKASNQFEKGFLALFYPMDPGVSEERRAFIDRAMAAKERLPPSQNTTTLQVPKSSLTTPTPLQLKEESSLSLSPKKISTNAPRTFSLPSIDCVISQSVALIYDQIFHEKEFAMAEAGTENVHNGLLPTTLSTPLSPTSSAILGLANEEHHLGKKSYLTPLLKKKHLTFLSANHLAILDLPKQVREVTPKFAQIAKLPQKRERILAPTSPGSIEVEAPSSQISHFTFYEELLISRKARTLPDVKLPLPKLTFSLVDALPQTISADTTPIYSLNPTREKKEIHFKVKSADATISDFKVDTFNLAHKDSPKILTSYNEAPPEFSGKATFLVADHILTMPITLGIEKKDVLLSAKSAAKEEPIWRTNISVALSKAEVPLLASKPLIEKEQLQAGNLLFPEEKLRDRISHERHLLANRLYRNIVTQKPTGSSEEMVRIESPFEPYVEYATDGVGGYYFGIELHLQKDLEIPTQKQNFLFMIDRSKATDKQQYEAYKKGVLKALTYLKKGDSFNIYIFDSRTKQLSPIPLPVSKQTIAKATTFLSEEKHGILFRSAKIYGLIDEMVFKTENDPHLNNVIFMAGPKTLSDLRSKRLEVQKLLDQKSKQANLFFVTSCDKDNFPMMQLLSTMSRGQAIYSPTNTSIPRKIANLVHRISKPIAQEVHVMTRSENAKIDLYTSTKLNRSHLYLNNAFKIYGHIDHIEDFDIILQGKGNDNWLHMNQRIKLKNALRVGRSLRKTIARIQVLPLYKNYIDEGDPNHLWEATKITAQHNIEQPYTWD